MLHHSEPWHKLLKLVLTLLFSSALMSELQLSYSYLGIEISALAGNPSFFIISVVVSPVPVHVTHFYLVPSCNWVLALVVSH